MSAKNGARPAESTWRWWVIRRYDTHAAEERCRIARNEARLERTLRELDALVPFNLRSQEPSNVD